MVEIIDDLGKIPMILTSHCLVCLHLNANCIWKQPVLVKRHSLISKACFINFDSRFPSSEIIPADDDTAKPAVKESSSPKKSGPKAIVVDLTLSDSDDDTPSAASNSRGASSAQPPSSSTSVIKSSSPVPHQHPSTPSRLYTGT